jgi:hypothetical protein
MVELRIADGAEQDRVRADRRLQRVVRQGRQVAPQRGSADVEAFERELMIELLADARENRGRRGNDFGPDAVTRQQNDAI